VDDEQVLGRGHVLPLSRLPLYHPSHVISRESALHSLLPGLVDCVRVVPYIVSDSPYMDVKMPLMEFLTVCSSLCRLGEQSLVLPGRLTAHVRFSSKDFQDLLWLLLGLCTIWVTHRWGIVAR